MLVVSLKANPMWSLSLVLLERFPETFLSFIIRFNVCFIGLTHNSLGVAGVKGVKTAHISPVSKVNYIIRADVIYQLGQPIKPFITYLGFSMGATKHYSRFTAHKSLLNNRPLVAP